MTTSLSSAALTMLSPSSVALIVNAGGRVSSSKVTLVVACGAALPARSLTLATTVMPPLVQVLTSAICAPVKDQVPLACTTAVLTTVCAGLTAEVKVTETTWPGSALVVPEITTAELSAVLMRLSPIRTASITSVGALLSSVKVLVACGAALPPASLTLAVTVTGPLAQVLMSAIWLPVRAQLPLACTTAVTVLVCVRLVLSVNTTVTVRPGSMLTVVPEITTSLSSTPLTRLSPSSTASILTTGLEVTTNSLAVESIAVLPAVSVVVAVML